MLAPNIRVTGGYATRKLTKIEAGSVRCVEVRSPASIANLGPGFDIMSLALEEPRDSVRLLVKRGSGRVEVYSSNQAVPSGKDNVAYIVAKAFLEEFGVSDVDLEIFVDKKIPPSRGLGSSAASSVATVKALSVALGVEADARTLLSIAVKGEEAVSGSRHFDNIAASLLGGIVISEPTGSEFIRLEPRSDIVIGVLIPEVPVPERKTGYSRSLLPEYIGLKDHVRQSYSLAKLIYAILTGDIERLGEAITSDFIVEPRRSVLIPYYYEIKKLALDSGALGFNISGAGPSVFYISRSTSEAISIGEKLKSYLTGRGVNAEYIVSRVSSIGVEVVGDEEC